MVYFTLGLKLLVTGWLLAYVSRRLITPEELIKIHWKIERNYPYGKVIFFLIGVFTAIIGLLLTVVGLWLII